MPYTCTNLTAGGASHYTSLLCFSLYVVFSVFLEKALEIQYFLVMSWHAWRLMKMTFHLFVHRKTHTSWHARGSLIFKPIKGNNNSSFHHASGILHMMVIKAEGGWNEERHMNEVKWGEYGECDSSRQHHHQAHKRKHDTMAGCGKWNA